MQFNGGRANERASGGRRHFRSLDTTRSPESQSSRRCYWAITTGVHLLGCSLARWFARSLSGRALAVVLLTLGRYLGQSAQANPSCAEPLMSLDWLCPSGAASAAACGS